MSSVFVVFSIQAIQPFSARYRTTTEPLLWCHGMKPAYTAAMWQVRCRSDGTSTKEKTCLAEEAIRMRPSCNVSDKVGWQPFFYFNSSFSFRNASVGKLYTILGDPGNSHRISQVERTSSSSLSHGIDGRLPKRSAQFQPRGASRRRKKKTSGGNLELFEW